ncbi:MAG TPA: SDR family NAD(P)-dependent oxidoreductase [Candidatus Binatia bacterium]|jgi:NAD(P)-dependent dehydrogenase (short-subunit alcohol dehydrogenase family)|nr:SDR family NAD(P)-dependent oxidoreductase [Candidatus Binatia bacterium]
MGLTGRAALVTGGGSGIGRGIALRLAHDGANVAVLDRDGAAACAVAAEVGAIGRRGVAVDGDVADTASVTRAVADARAALGPLLVLVNAAGISGFAPLADMTDAQWDGMIAVHLRGTFVCTRAVLPDMLAGGSGRVVNISSVGGLRGGPMLTHYAAAKAGVLGFTKALAIEVGGRGITVNAIAPGLVDTPMLRASGMSPALLEQATRQMPVGRLGTPEDIAAACAFLVSDEAAWFTGQVLSPNGGGHL